MAQDLPVEIVREILSTATEVFLLSDRATALGIALTSTLGYHAAIPILYRTLYAIEGNSQAIRYLFDDHGVAATELGKVLRIPPSQRLCPLVQRLFLGHAHGISPADLDCLTNLRKITSYYEFGVQKVAFTLTHLTILSASRLYHKFASLTHVSYYFSTNHSEEVMGNLTECPSPRTITHITLDMNDCPSADAV